MDEKDAETSMEIQARMEQNDYESNMDVVNRAETSTIPKLEKQISSKRELTKNPLSLFKHTALNIPLGSENYDLVQVNKDIYSGYLLLFVYGIHDKMPRSEQIACLFIVLICAVVQLFSMIILLSSSMGRHTENAQQSTLVALSLGIIIMFGTRELSQFITRYRLPDMDPRISPYRVWVTILSFFQLGVAILGIACAIQESFTRGDSSDVLLSSISVLNILNIDDWLYHIVQPELRDELFNFKVKKYGTRLRWSYWLIMILSVPVGYLIGGAFAAAKHIKDTSD